MYRRCEFKNITIFTRRSDLKVCTTVLNGFLLGMRQYGRTDNANVITAERVAGGQSKRPRRVLGETMTTSVFITFSPRDISDYCVTFHGISIRVHDAFETRTTMVLNSGLRFPIVIHL